MGYSTMPVKNNVAIYAMEVYMYVMCRYTSNEKSFDSKEGI